MNIQKPHLKLSREARRGSSYALHLCKAQQGNRTPNFLLFFINDIILLCFSGLGSQWMHVLDFNSLLFLNKSVLLEEKKIKNK